MSIKEKFNFKTLIIIVLLILIALISIFKLSIIASSVDFHKSNIDKLDEKKMKVFNLTTASAVAATALSAIPGDATTPLANQIINITSYLLIVTGVIYLEKVLLTLTGLVTFKYLIPISCGLGILYLISNKELFRIISIKLAAFGILIFIVVPISVCISSWIEQNYHETLESSIEAAESININESENVKSEDSEEKQGFFKDVVNKVQDSVDSLKTEVEESIEKGKKALSNLIDAIAVLIITSCIIPLLVLSFFIWLIKMLFGINVNIPRPPKIKPIKGNRHVDNNEESGSD